MGIFTKAIVAALPLVPRPLMRRMASRYIAGESLDEALALLTKLQSEGYPGAIDLLGEDVAGESAARAVQREYLHIATATKARGLDSYLSIKPTHLGLRTSRDLALELFTELARATATSAQFVRVEMEDSTTTDDTLWLFTKLRESFDNVGIVLQARLKRTLADVRALPSESDVRIVKGIYIEPAAIAYSEYIPIRDSFSEACQLLWRAGHRVRLATHDEAMGARCIKVASDLGVAKDRYEFQVMLGVQEHNWRRWRGNGHTVRVYVPFGPEWRAYSTRRLKRNPALAGHVLRALFRGPR